MARRMTSGTASGGSSPGGATRLVGWLLLTLTLAVAQATAEEPTAALLRQLEASMADVKTVRTRFVQEKKLALFNQPLVTRGVILVEMPNKLLWRVDSPIQYVLSIDGRQARQWDGETGRTQKIPLANNPVFAAVTEQLQAWFGGRYGVLAKDYDIGQQPNHPNVLIFTPKPETAAANMLQSVMVTCREDRRYIAAIRIDERGGDSTVMTFAETEINVPIAAKEWEL